jgi:exopolyphosphatase / guanosine-5'-triphosphate,3'-diphosphate pyrophosphatase
MLSQSEIFGALDIGSNAIRWIIAEVNNLGELIVVDKNRYPLRLGIEVFANGSVSDQSISKLCLIVKEFLQVAIANNVKSTRAVATSAIREAQNQFEIIDLILAETGLKIEVITGLQEANFIYCAVKSVISFKEIPSSCLIDIGGGSFEISWLEFDQVIDSSSHTIGVIRPIELLNKYGDLTMDKAIEEFFIKNRSTVIGKGSNCKIPSLIATGGSVEDIVKVGFKFNYIKAKNRILLKEINNFYPFIKSFSFEDRVNKLNLKPDRADIIIPSIKILLCMANITDSDYIEVPKVGLKEGIIRSLI